MKPTSYLLERGIINGYADNTIKPNAKVSEIEIAKVWLKSKDTLMKVLKDNLGTQVVDLYRLKAMNQSN